MTDDNRPPWWPTTPDGRQLFEMVAGKIAEVCQENAVRGAVMAEHEALVRALWTD